MVRVAQFVLIALILGSPAVASAGPAEDANAAVDRWSAAYSGNDPEIVAKNYWPDAILLGATCSAEKLKPLSKRTSFPTWP